MSIPRIRSTPSTSVDLSNVPTSSIKDRGRCLESRPEAGCSPRGRDAAFVDSTLFGIRRSSTRATSVPHLPRSTWSIEIAKTQLVGRPSAAPIIPMDTVDSVACMDTSTQESATLSISKRPSYGKSRSRSCVPWPPISWWAPPTSTSRAQCKLGGLYQSH